MKIIKSLTAIFMSLMLLQGFAKADASAFQGAYIGVQGSIAGVELDGKYNDPTQTNPNSTGQVGMTGMFGSVQAGYHAGGSGNAFVGLGINYTPTGDASFAAKELANNKKVNLELSDLLEVFIEPSVAVTSNSALFVRLGYTEGELSATGNDVQNQTIDLDGMTYSLGMKTVTDGGFYIKAEAGMTEFDGIKVKNITDTASGTTASATADPTIAFGAITIGKKF